MKKPKITMNITKEDTGYSAHALIKNISINTQAETLEELKANILEVVNLSFEDKGFVYSIEEIKLQLDIASFFDFYKVVNAKALSERIGMNQSLLAQYIKGIKIMLKNLFKKKEMKAGSMVVKQFLGMQNRYGK